MRAPMPAANSEQSEKAMEVDVVVVGSGRAGLTTRWCDQGAQGVVLEKHALVLRYLPHFQEAGVWLPDKYI